MEKKIKNISIVCQTGAAVYELGFKGIASIKEEWKATDSSQTKLFYVCTDKEGNELVAISATAPIVIERF